MNSIREDGEHFLEGRRKKKKKANFASVNEIYEAIFYTLFNEKILLVALGLMVGLKKGWNICGAKVQHAVQNERILSSIYRMCRRNMIRRITPVVHY